MRTLSDSTSQPQRRTAIVARTLRSHNLDIVALSETRFADVSQLEEVGAGYTIFWIGKTADEPQQSGVGFAIKSSIVRNLSSLPRGISERIMTLRVSLEK